VRFTIILQNISLFFQKLFKVKKKGEIITTETQQILEELKLIKEELNSIKENMLDKDMILSTEEKKMLKESFTNEREGKLVSGKDLRKQLGL